MQITWHNMKHRAGFPPLASVRAGAIGIAAGGNSGAT